MPRRARLLSLLVIALATFAAVRPAAADKDVDEAKALLDTLSTSASKDERVAAAAKLAELAPHVVDALGEFLKRKHESTPEQRRTVLRNIKASVPDKGGNFSSPGHEKAAKVRADDAFDWFAELVAQPPQAGLGDVIADDAAIRALAGSKQLTAAKVILDVAFAADTIVYRDECGRYLRRMSPYSVPVLIVASQSKKDRSKQRYSNYQLERVDRQEPNKALAAAADDEELLIAILDAYGESEHREAVPAVLGMTNADAPRVRAAARTAWMTYVTPPDPPPPKKGHLKMTGGVQSATAKPLWLNSLQLARIEIENKTDELFHETLTEDAEDPLLQEASKRIFAFYDQERSGRDAAEVAAGQAKAEGGDLPGAVAIFDRLIAADPQRAEKGDMAAVYFQYAEALAGEEKWDDAAAMYSKAHGLAPDGPNANDALAAHYFALGKAQAAAGKDGGAAFRKAVELKPDYAEAKQAEKAAVAPPGGSTPSKRWMLYVAGAVALGAFGLLAMGLARETGTPVTRLLVLEGLDGAGTTTQARRLVDSLNARGRAAHLTREPSDGPVGRLIREMLVGGHAIAGEKLEQTTFSLLFAADRMDHLQREVEPALAAGSIVVSDRWYHSSLAYQGTGAERAWIRALNKRARRPDLTLLLRVRPEVAAERRVAAGRAQELFEDIAMQRRVSDGYDAVVAELQAEGEPIEILDGEADLDAVTAAIERAIAPLL